VWIVAIESFRSRVIGACDRLGRGMLVDREQESAPEVMGNTFEESPGTGSKSPGIRLDIF
jgi:hypothetical protein